MISQISKISTFGLGCCGEKKASTFRSYFAKKIWGKNFQNSKLYSSFCKSDHLKKCKNPFSVIFRFFNFQIFSNSDAKSNFFDSFCIHYNVCTYKKHFKNHFWLKLPNSENFC